MLTAAKPEGLRGAEGAVHSDELRPGGPFASPRGVIAGCSTSPHELTAVGCLDGYHLHHRPNASLKLALDRGQAVRRSPCTAPAPP